MTDFKARLAKEKAESWNTKIVLSKFPDRQKAVKLAKYDVMYMSPGLTRPYGLESLSAKRLSI